MGSLVALPDEILELVLLRLDSPISLLRAASTSKEWRRVATGAAFLRRYRSLHKPPVAGCYYNRQLFFRPRFHLPPPCAAGAVGVRHFSVDFIPSNNDGTTSRWTVKHSRGSLLLLLLEKTDSKHRSRDMIVCEPLTRSFVVIPPLTASASYSSITATLHDGDSSEAGGIGMANFRVFCLVHDSHNHHLADAGIFTAGGAWNRVSMIYRTPMQTMGTVARRMYWRNGGKKVVVLNQDNVEFSSFLLPDGEDWKTLMTRMKVSVIADSDGEVRIVVAEVAGTNLKVSARPRGGGDEWVVEKNVQLTAATFHLPLLARFYLRTCQETTDTGRALILVPSGATVLWFRLDIETLEAERVPESAAGYGATASYPSEFPWPLSFHACTDPA